MSELFRRSASLFACPSFLEGFCRILDLGATFDIYNYDKDPKEADTNALLSDWLAVGDAIIDSVERFDSSGPAQKEFQFLEK